MRQPLRSKPLPTPVPCRDAVLYVRVSSKEQEKEGFSIPAQRKLLTAYAAEKGLTIVEDFEDVETAKRAGREDFGRMVSFLQRTRTCRVILVEKTDRLYRNIKDWITLADLDCEIHLVKEGATISNESRSSEKFMHGIRVLMAKNYVDNLSEEVRKGMREKAEQGHWPTIAHIGYRNNLQTKRIEIDPERGPLVAKLFEWYASGNFSLKMLTTKAQSVGLTNPRRGRRITKSEIHRLLHNPIYYGEFDWKGTRYQGLHEPLISRALFDAVQDVFEAANHPKQTKRQHAFLGLLTCGRCGCAITAEVKKGRYVYYHCTEFRGRCGNSYVREEALSQLFEDVVRRVQIPPAIADSIAQALRESQEDKERFHRTSILRLQQQYITIQARMDRAYEDRLADRIPEDLWQRKAQAWRRELESVRRDMSRHERASENYTATGSQILELAKHAENLFVRQDASEQAGLLKTLLSNCTFDRGTLCPTYVKPFDLLVAGNQSGDWRGRRDSNPRPPA